MSAGRQEAFDHFRRDNPLNQKLEEHKRRLKQRYTEAKTLGEEINQCRNRISNQFQLIFTNFLCIINIISQII
jgi:kinesin family protein 6/9